MNCSPFELKDYFLKELSQPQQREVETHVKSCQACCEELDRLQLTEAARRNLVRSGYDPNYGARPLKRALQKKIETPLGRLLLQGGVRGGQPVLVDVNKETGDLAFTAKTEEPVGASS